MNHIDHVKRGMELALASHTPRNASHAPLDEIEGMGVCLSCFSTWNTPLTGQTFWHKCKRCEPEAVITPQAFIQLDDIETGLNQWVAYGALLMIAVLTTNRVDMLPPDVFNLNTD